MKTDRCYPETSTRDCHHSLRNIPHEGHFLSTSRRKPKITLNLQFFFARGTNCKNTDEKISYKLLRNRFIMIVSNVQNVKFYISYYCFLFYFINNMPVKGQLHVFYTHTQTPTHTHTHTHKHPPTHTHKHPPPHTHTHTRQTMLIPRTQKICRYSVTTQQLVRIFNTKVKCQLCLGRYCRFTDIPVYLHSP
jgi:hypothetical protein